MFRNQRQMTTAIMITVRSLSHGSTQERTISRGQRGAETLTEGVGL